MHKRLFMTLDPVVPTMKFPIRRVLSDLYSKRVDKKYDEKARMEF